MTIQDTIVELSSIIAIQANKIDKLQKDIAARDVIEHAMSNNLSNLSSQNSDLQAELATLRSEDSVLEANNNALRDENDALRYQIDDYREANENLRNEVAQLERRILGMSS